MCAHKCLKHCFEEIYCDGPAGEQCPTGLRTARQRQPRGVVSTVLPRKARLPQYKTFVLHAENIQVI